MGDADTGAAVRHFTGDRASARPGESRRFVGVEERDMVEQVMKDARRLASIGTFFIVIGWVFVIYALIAGLVWWIDLAQREAFNIIEAFAISANAIGTPIFIAFVLAGFGYFLRLFALYVASKSQ
jgi:TRAP-type C4-dicarboxylate transport system permease small subunit